VTVQSGQVVSGIDLTQTLTPDFQVTSVPVIPEQPGQSTTAVVSTTALEGFAGTIDLAIPNSPPGITAALGDSSLAAGDATTLTVTADPTAAGTTSIVQVTATGGSGSSRRQIAIPVTVLSRYAFTTQDCLHVRRHYLDPPAIFHGAYGTRSESTGTRSDATESGAAFA
jgi:hypothetical protein